MAKIISKNNLSKEVKEFLETLGEDVEGDYLVIQIKEEKVVVQPLKKYLEERKKKKS